MKAFSGFVSNLNKSMMRCRLWCVLCVLAHRSGLACSLRLYESQISKLSRASGLDEGQPNNRELNEPSRRAVRALRQSHFNWTRLEVASDYYPVILRMLLGLFEFLVCQVLGFSNRANCREREN